MAKGSPVSPQFSANYGCVLVITMMVVVGSLVSFGIYVGLQQNKQFDAFTTAERTSVQRPDPGPGALEKVLAKLKPFSEAVAAEQETEVALTPNDLNVLIDSIDELEPLRDLVAFTGISSTVDARVSMPINTLFRKGQRRYLNGVFRFLPTMDKGRFVLRVQAIESDFGDVPEGFRETFSETSNLLHPYREIEEWNQAIRSIHEVRLEKGLLILKAKKPPIDY